MAQRKKRSPRRVKPAAVPIPGQGQPVRLVAVAVRELTYRELPPPIALTLADVHARGALSQQVINLNGGIGFSPPNLVDVTIRATLIPVGDLKLFELAVRISGLFEKSPGVTNHQAAELLSGFAGRLLFPFVREALMTMTSKTIFGSLPIQPMTLGPLFPAEVLEKITD